MSRTGPCPTHIIQTTMFSVGRSHETFYMVTKLNASPSTKRKNTFQNEIRQKTKPRSHPWIWSHHIHKGFKSWKTWFKGTCQSLCWIWHWIKRVPDLLANKKIHHCWKECCNQWKQCSYNVKPYHHPRQCIVWGGEDQRHPIHSKEFWKNWEIEHVDIKSAYLNALLKETIFMKPPRGVLKPGQEGKFLRLLKGLYRLKQAGWGWYQEMSQVLIKELGFKCSAADHSVFFWCSEGEHTIITVATDDMALTSRWAVNAENFPKVLGYYVKYGICWKVIIW